MVLMAQMLRWSLWPKMLRWSLWPEMLRWSLWPKWKEKEGLWDYNVKMVHVAYILNNSLGTALAWSGMEWAGGVLWSRYCLDGLSWPNVTMVLDAYISRGNLVEVFFWLISVSRWPVVVSGLNVKMVIVTKMEWIKKIITFWLKEINLDIEYTEQDRNGSDACHYYASVVALCDSITLLP